MIILSIDPGTEKIGYAIFEKNKKSKKRCDFITSGLIKTMKSTKPEYRLREIHEKIVAIIQQYNPTELAIEQLFFFKNAKTVISVAQSQGVIVLAAAQHNLSVTYLTPLQIKQTVTGNGAADKQSVFKMLKLELGDKLTVSDDDESDAIACGLAYCYLKNSLVE